MYGILNINKLPERVIILDLGLSHHGIDITPERFFEEYDKLGDETIDRENFYLELLLSNLKKILERKGHKVEYEVDGANSKLTINGREIKL